MSKGHAINTWHTWAVRVIVLGLGLSVAADFSHRMCSTANNQRQLLHWSLEARDNTSDDTACIKRKSLDFSIRYYRCTLIAYLCLGYENGICTSLCRT